MFFDKPVHDLTFEDIVAFCQKQVPEGKQLDYKYLLPKNKEKFAKVIASFANALGGTVIIGVNDDKNDKPRPPFTGIAYHEKMRNTIEDIIQTYIDPVVFVDVNICVSPDGQRMFVVVNIPQSNLTPHLVGKLKRAYIRTGQSSRPEILVHPDKLPWLLNHRKKSERLRHILYDKAESHFENYLKTKNVSSAALTVATLSLLPLYPQEALADYRQLPRLIAVCAPELAHAPHMTLQPVQDGAALIDGSSRHRMVEFNSYGLLMDKWDAAQTVQFNGHDTRALDFAALARRTVAFFRRAEAFFNKLSFGGPLYFRLKLANARGLRSLYQAKAATVLEDYLRLDENYNIAEITARRESICQSTLQMAAWSLGLRLSNEEITALVRRLLEETK
ncbi:RNA-binding domain-containing protein [Candidatus Avelusimicrobium facis]|uniref:AlbA family DNA-binding domain-containing protein n=1 Tax=Candidatus Avelusimicrobium facis TaxID=3416203 RepID=UPI0015B392CF